MARGSGQAEHGVLNRFRGFDLGGKEFADRGGADTLGRGNVAGLLGLSDLGQGGINDPSFALGHFHGGTRVALGLGDPGH